MADLILASHLYRECTGKLIVRYTLTNNPTNVVFSYSILTKLEIPESNIEEHTIEIDPNPGWIQLITPGKQELLEIDGSRKTARRTTEFTVYSQHSVTIQKTKSAQNITFKPSGSIVIDNNYYTLSGSYNISVPTLDSYTISYNANGGVGAPANQTKWYGEALTLQAGKPTREGYGFTKWNTAADGSGTDYDPSGSYTANAAAILYAQWQTNSKVTIYDENGSPYTGILKLYDDEGKLHDCIITIYDSDGNKRHIQ